MGDYEAYAREHDEALSRFWQDEDFKQVSDAVLVFMCGFGDLSLRILSRVSAHTHIHV